MDFILIKYQLNYQCKRLAMHFYIKKTIQ